jgi:hypothetical protein
VRPGKNLPAGRAEIEEIERLRQRRVFEDSLPPMTDEASFLVRRKLMEAQELRQWQFRERVADEANEARLTALQEALQKRDKEAEFLIEQVCESHCCPPPRSLSCRRGAVRCGAMQCDAVPCRAVPCRAVPCRAVPCRAVPCRAVPCRAVPWRCGAMRCDAMRCDAMRCQRRLFRAHRALQRVEDIQRRANDEKDATLSKIQKRRIQALRKLGKARQASEAQV